MLTDGRRVSVINAPAGSGKTRVLAEAARIWAAAGLGPVIGITPSQSARNTLAAGVPVSYNSAQFLGHLPGRRGARGPVPIGPGTLLVIDEASMMSGPDLADLIAYAEARGAKVILAGDTSQLQAVENGGGMSLLADALGYVRLAEPVRFRARLGTASQPAAARRRHHRAGRLRPARPDHRRRAGADDGRRRGRLRRADRRRHRHPADGRRPRAAPGTVPPHPRRPHRPGHRPGRARGHASPTAPRPAAGDLIICTRNDHTVEAGEPGRTLANGDLLRIEAITADGLIVRRALDADPRTGQRRWTDRHLRVRGLSTMPNSGYAVTDHVAQGRTVHTGLAVITGTEDRQHAYVALTRGTDANLAYVFTAVPEARRPGARPAAGPRTGPL